jgi:uncharacterized protein (TIGR03083 family)
MNLLRGLSPSDWTRPTVCRGWTVHDIAAHMLDTQIRILSMGRDGFAGVGPETPIDGWASLVEFLNRLNAEWVKVARRISPPIMVDLLGHIGPQLARHVETLDPHGPALFAVAWAGEDASENWFDIGRNYTEYWHHQHQIRDAVDAPGLFSRKWLHPVIALFLRAVPRAYAGIDAGAGTRVRVEVSGEAGGVWFIEKGESAWRLSDGEPGSFQASISLPDDAAWRFLTKGLDPQTARTRMRFDGDTVLASRFLDSLAIMA